MVKEALGGRCIVQTGRLPTVTTGLIYPTLPRTRGQRDMRSSRPIEAPINLSVSHSRPFMNVTDRIAPRHSPSETRGHHPPPHVGPQVSEAPEQHQGCGLENSVSASGSPSRTQLDFQPPKRTIPCASKASWTSWTSGDDDYLAESVTEIIELRWVQKPDVCSCSKSKLSGLVIVVGSLALLERNSLCSFFLKTTSSSSVTELVSSTTCHYE